MQTYLETSANYASNWLYRQLICNPRPPYSPSPRKALDVAAISIAALAILGVVSTALTFHVAYRDEEDLPAATSVASIWATTYVMSVRWGVRRFLDEMGVPH